MMKDKNGKTIKKGDMVRFHERYHDWLGIVLKIYPETIQVQPIGRKSTPVFQSGNKAEIVSSLDV